MKLTLDLIGPPRLMGARLRHELRSGSLTIGRSPEADWVIPDTSRLISRRHLRIDASHGDFVLTDLSANGVFVNASEVPVGYGASIRLHDGDEFSIGEARLVATIDANANTAAVVGRISISAEPLSASAAPMTGARDPLGGPFGGSASAEQTPSPLVATSREASHKTIDANWMIQAESASSRQQSDRKLSPIHVEAEKLPAQNTGNNHAGSLSLLALVELHPELSARHLAQALDEAASTMDASILRTLHEKLHHFVSPRLRTAEPVQTSPATERTR